MAFDNDTRCSVDDMLHMENGKQRGIAVGILQKKNPEIKQDDTLQNGIALHDINPAHFKNDSARRKFFDPPHAFFQLG